MQEIACPFCGRRTALYPGTTVACPSCGRPITAPAAEAPIEDDSATRPSIPPVDPVTVFPDESTRPSIPPADPVTVFPDDETTRPVTLAADVQPGVASSAVATDDVTADYPQVEKPDRTSTLGAQATPSTEPFTQPVQPADAPAAWPGADIPSPGVSPAEASSPPAPVVAPPTTSRRGPAGVIAVIVLVILLLALAAAGILYANGKLSLFSASPTPTVAATATPQPTATPTITLTTFSDPDHVYSIGYPSNWVPPTALPSNNGSKAYLISNPPAMASFDVGTLSTTTTPADQIADEVLTQLNKQSGIANRQGPTQVIVGGDSWTQESGDVSLTQNGQPTAMHAEALAVIHGNHTIYMLALAPVDTFATMEPYFQQMLQSFTFE